MKTIFLLLFSLIIGKISIAQNQDWQKGDKIDLSEILPLRPTNGKTLNQSFFEQKVNILVFADLKNVEGLLLIDDLILLQKNYPKIQFSLFDEGPINSNNKFWTFVCSTLSTVNLIFSTWVGIYIILSFIKCIFTHYL